MIRLSDLVERHTLQQIVEKVVDGDVEPKPNNEPKDEMKFVKMHKVKKTGHPAYDDDGNESDVYNATNIKVDQSVRKGKVGGTDDEGTAFNPNEELEEGLFSSKKKSERTWDSESQREKGKKGGAASAKATRERNKDSAKRIANSRLSNIGQTNSYQKASLERQKKGTPDFMMPGRPKPKFSKTKKRNVNFKLEEFEEQLFDFLEENYDIGALLEAEGEEGLAALIEYVLEEEQLDEGIYKNLPASSKKYAARLKDDKASIARPQFDKDGNVVLTKKAAKNVDKLPPKSRKIGRAPLTPKTKKSRYDEESEQLDELYGKGKLKDIKKHWTKKFDSKDAKLRRSQEYRYNDNTYYTRPSGRAVFKEPAKYTKDDAAKRKFAKGKMDRAQHLSDTIDAKKAWTKKSRKLRKTYKEEIELDEERKESAKIADAFLAGRSAKGKRTTTDGKSVHLHGNKIAWHGDDGHVHMTHAGWGTTTTKERLNTIADRMGHGRPFHTKKHQLHHGDKPIGDDDVVKLKRKF